MELINELAGQNDAIGSHLLTKNAKPPHRMQALFRRLTIYLGLKKDTQDVTVTFFDLFGIVLVVYEEGFAALLNVVIPLITVFIWGSRLRTILVPDFRVILRMCLVMVACILGAFASSTFTSLMYAYGLKKNLVWYGSSLRATLLYGPPALFGAVSMLLFLLPKGLSVHRFDQMLFAITLFSFVASIVLTKFGIRSSYIPLALLVISDICALQGASVHPLIRHAEIMFVHIVIGAKMSSVALSVMLPLLGRAASKVSHDAIAAGLITLFGIPVFILPSLPILCHYAGYLRKIRGFTYLMCIVSGVWFIVISPKRAGELSGFPYSTDAPKRLAFIHFYSPQQSPPTVLWMATLDPIAPDTKRLLSKLPDADIDIGSIDSLPQWGSMNSTALESFRGMQFVFQERLFFRSGERPRLPIPIVSILSEEEVESGWNISVLIKASQSHMITARIPTDETSPVKAWSFNVTMNDYPDDIWIKHSGSDEFVFWLILNKQLETKSIRPTVKMAVTSSRMGASRSPTDLQKLVFAEWEAPVLLVSTGIEVEL